MTKRQRSFDEVVIFLVLAPMAFLLLLAAVLEVVR